MNDLDRVEITIEDANLAIAKAETMSKLSKNPEFKELILEGYFKEEAYNLVLYKANPANGSTENQANILRAIDAIGNVRLYLQRIIDEGKEAAIAKYEAEATKEDILSEDMS